ncbi:hypothetical protein EXU85_17355 [Spirosoma sp. KCTC 42546]|uniref:hypothetical protein n=1 Tax=Spirosoma sp. KCTC 42546 TaxID=2520506 RepID=UPI00115ACD8D|nr:hypothetical protein [Spirosoma sp. KCTC 42546]QDK80273.1 hypothetical protein EXU85_17355 [Spirosoma sp. KCTC 42546]
MSTGNPPSNLPSQPAFTITAQLASHKQGIVNVPAGVDSYFGEHGKIVVVTLPNDQRIHCPIERKKTSKHGASFSHPSLKEYFGNKAQRDWEYRVKISGTNTVSIRPIVEQPVEEQLVEEPQEQSQES